MTLDEAAQSTGASREYEQRLAVLGGDLASTRWPHIPALAAPAVVAETAP